MTDYVLLHTYLAAVRRRHGLGTPAKPRALRRALLAGDVIEAALWREARARGLLHEQEAAAVDKVWPPPVRDGRRRRCRPDWAELDRLIGRWFPHVRLAGHGKPGEQMVIGGQEG